ncbi:hypothetical protein VTO73DRAFT_200 [Trametes versicolor]
MRFASWHRHTFLLSASALGVLSFDGFVDDTDLNIVYAPANQWVQGATCGSSCAIQPDVPSVHDGTWHYATYDPTQDITPPSITYKFTATTIAVRNILPPLVSTASTSHVELAFELDGVDQPGFSYSPTAASVFTYGAVVMSVGDLSLEEHTLVIRVPPTQAAVVLFDCFELTLPDPPSQAPVLSPSSSSSSTTSKATPSSTTTTSSSQPSSTQLATPSSTTSLTAFSIASFAGSPSSTPQSSLHPSPAVSSSGDSNIGASNTQLLQTTSGTGTASNGPGALGDVTTASPGSSSSAAPQSQSAPPSGSSAVSSAAIGGAVGGGALLVILLAALCIFRVRRARRRRTSVGNEAPLRDGEAAGGAGDSPGPTAQFPYRDVGPTVVHRPQLQGFAGTEDPFADGSDHGSLPGDMATHGGVEMAGSHLFAGTAASLDARPPSPIRGSPPHRLVSESLHRWNTDEKSVMESSVAYASPRPPLVSGRSDSTTSFAQTESSSQLLVDPSPRLGEQLVEQLVALREEMAQLRQHREEAVLLEAPPRYGEA